ncbi:MAG: tRNA epoxyqueuosine(34) reductase QueG [Ignavibacteriales bacterium]|nr:tRNA epoxyqueuosine(34) reductase QueG [Ignavibacteriales bacterium]
MQADNAVVKALALHLGFDLCGFAGFQLIEKESRLLENWLANGYQAGMQYMEKNISKRRDVKEILADAQSIISLGLHYNTPFVHGDEPGKGKISRYAWGKDYHLLIWEKLELFIDELQRYYPGIEAVSYVDTGPVMDKAWAVNAGLGWMGKHSNVINPDSGSWFFIANIITNAQFTYSELITDHCGSCNRCIDACPTQAIISDYVVDANRCISYLTIENKNEIQEELKSDLDNWLFGCDVCQDVCPWNKKFAFETDKQEFFPVRGETTISISEILGMENNEFKERFADSPVKRAKLKGLKRNASALSG